MTYNIFVLRLASCMSVSKLKHVTETECVLQLNSDLQLATNFFYLMFLRKYINSFFSEKQQMENGMWVWWALSSSSFQHFAELTKCSSACPLVCSTLDPRVQPWFVYWSCVWWGGGGGDDCWTLWHRKQDVEFCIYFMYTNDSFMTTVTIQFQ